MDNGEGDSQLEPDSCQVKRSNEDSLSDELQIQPFHRQKYWLPPEMWDNIFDKFDNPNDILLCSDVCYNWNSILQPRMTSVYFELILPKLFPYLRKSDLLSCSAVSKDWNRWIDTIALNFRKSIRFIVGIDRLPCLVMETDEGEIDMELFLAEKEEFADNQFDNLLMYRQVVLFSENDGDMDDPVFEVFCQHLLGFLQRFGNYIYELDVYTNMKPIQMIQFISICLSNTPNLDVVMLATDIDNYVADDEDAQQIDDFLTASPLPNSSVRNLQLDLTPYRLADFLLQRYGNQLVYVHDFCNVDFQKLISRGVTFQNIKIFRTTLYGTTFISNVDRVGSVYYASMILQLLKWTLSEVDLTFVGGFDYSWRSFHNLFTALQLHQPHIHTLRLSLHPERTPGHLYSFPVLNLESMNMPSLKRLTLDQVGIPPVRVFQKATPKLEYLTIYSRDNYEWLLPEDKLDAMWKALPNCKMIRSSNFIKDVDAENPAEPHTHTFIR